MFMEVRKRFCHEWHIFDSIDEYKQNHKQKYHTTGNHFVIKGVEVTSLEKIGEDYFLRLKSNGKKITGRVYEEIPRNWLDLPIKEGDIVKISGFYQNLNSTLKEGEILPIRFLRKVKQPL